ncbi:hypothetical protein [Candidatus Nesciobacter abundans]|uniref:Gcp-like domain-containing protein n=1 Tax=Candidatus Nesciobacter abundans TaxID=2601668 RepID=A0A5C0UFP7_9PROT|nr:hypothetical protein [Candidatus Nesciobacter abundans]QEK38926.1 hypothetical protein FZC36_00535 [Candidatus Nesciobacter abundans]
MYSIVLFYINKDFVIEIFLNHTKKYSKKISNARTNLVQEISNALQEEKITLSEINRISFLRGPGSFSSIRIAFATVMAIKTSHPNIICNNVSVDEIIPSPIIIKLNKATILHYFENWQVKKNEELNKDITYNSMDKNDTFKTNVIENIGYTILIKALKLKEPLYIYEPYLKPDFKQS